MLSYAFQILKEEGYKNIETENSYTEIVTEESSSTASETGNEENYISSDIPAILSFTKDFYLLNVIFWRFYVFFKRS